MDSATNAADVAILAALADPIRLAIVRRLSKAREVAGVELAKELGISRSLLCHHAGILAEAGVATRRKEGQTGYLSLNAARLRRCLGKLGKQTGAAMRPTGRLRVGAKGAKPRPR